MVNIGADFAAVHCRAARALLGWTQQELAERAEVGRMTVTRFEAGETVRPAQRTALLRTMREAGARFPEAGGEYGNEIVETGAIIVRKE